MSGDYGEVASASCYRPGAKNSPRSHMRFFFPDSQDQVNPRFDFVSEEHAVHRIRQRDDRYAHEVLIKRPFDGLLISKAIIDGQSGKGATRYTTASRNRMYREGARDFFRLNGEHSDVLIMGDCGAFTYFAEEEPPYTVDEVADFYQHCGLDWGVAPDHIVFGFRRPGSPTDPTEVAEWERRRMITIRNASLFLETVETRGRPFEPVAVAHGWSAETYAESVERLQEIGYNRIAMGGMVPLRTVDILRSLEAVHGVLQRETNLHLLGITRVEDMQTFASFGVTSIDSTSPFRQAFKDDRNNYYTTDSSYVAIKVPQVDGNAALKRAIKSGVVDQGRALELERDCLATLRAYDNELVGIEAPLRALGEYTSLIGLPQRIGDYERTLRDRPWKVCSCGLCEKLGVEIVLFRGSERNKRRGFHNLSMFRERLTQKGFRSLKDLDEVNE